MRDYRSRQRGFTLTEVMIAIGIASVSLMTFAGVMFQTGQMVNQVKVSSTCNTNTLSLLNTLQDDNALLNSFLKDANLAACIPNRNCLSQYTAAATPTTPNNMNFVLWDKASRNSTAALVDAAGNPHSGFTRDGVPCNTFDNTPGVSSDGCSIKPKVEWKPISDSQIVLYLSHLLPPAMVSSRACAQVALPIDLDKFRVKMAVPTNCLGDWGADPGTGTWQIGACSAPCAGGAFPTGGSQTFKVTQPNTPGGNTCLAADGAIQPCNTAACPVPVDCVGSWSACSAPCAGGANPAGGTQSFSITTPAVNGGLSCTFAAGQTQTCNTAACPVPTACVGSWSACTAACAGGATPSGGTQTFTVTTPETNGGPACTNATGDTMACNTQACPAPVNCAGTWSACTAPCAGGAFPTGGTRTFTETIAAANGGASCAAANGAVQPCNTAACPGPQNCVGAWSACTSTQVMPSDGVTPCGDGTSTFVISTPASGGGSCPQIAGGNIQECFIGHCRPPSCPKADFEAFARDKVSHICRDEDDNQIMVGRFTSFQGKVRHNIARINKDGSVDDTFTPNLGVRPTDAVYTCKVQADGKILVGGKFKAVADSGGLKARGNFARLNKDGTVDTTFATGAGFDDEIFDIEVQSTGEIVVGGRFHDHEGSKRKRIARVHGADGTDDATFNPGSGFNDDVCDIEINNDKNDFDVANNLDDLIVGGRFDKCNGASRPYIERLNKDGSHDPAFINSGFDDEVYSVAREKRRVGGFQRIDIIVGGKFNTCEGRPSKKIAKLYGSDGGVFPLVDPTNPFNPGAGFDNDVYSVKVDEENNILVGGAFTSYNGRTNKKLEKIINDDGISGVQGTGDPTFVNSTVNDDVISIGDEIGGKVYVGSSMLGAPGPGVTSPALQDFLTKIENWTLPALAIVAGAPSKMNSFYSGAGSNASIFDSALQADGKILICTNDKLGTYNGALAHALARVNPDGTLDAAFSANIGTRITICDHIGLQPDGKIIVFGAFDGSFPWWSPGGPLMAASTGTDRFIRFNPDGTYDPTFRIFSFSPRSHKFFLQPDGKIILVNNWTGMMRVDALGNIDPTFVGPALNGQVNKILRQSTGKFIVIGAFSSADGNQAWGMMRMGVNGGTDTTFTAPMWDPYGAREALAIQADDKILYGIGTSTTYNGIATPARWVRLTANGSVDPTFNPPTIVDPTYNGPEEILVQPDGKILVHEGNSNPNPLITVPMFGLARYLPNGTPDLTFVRQPLSTLYFSTYNHIILEPGTGRIIFTGLGTPNQMIWRLRPNGTVDSYQ